MANVVKYGWQALHFLLELAALAGLALWGAHVGGGPLASIALGVGIPLVVIILWGIFAAPRAPRYVPMPWHLIPEALLFGSGVAGFFVSGHPIPGWTFMAALAVDYALGFGVHLRDISLRELQQQPRQR